jgi:hypothetical protein
MIDQKQRENLTQKVAAFSQDVLTDKDKDVLARIITTEPMLKALGQIYGFATNSYLQFGGVDLSNESERHKASALQGHIQGYFGAIDLLFQLITLPEEIEDDEPESVDA